MDDVGDGINLDVDASELEKSWIYEDDISIDGEDMIEEIEFTEELNENVKVVEKSKRET